MTAPASLLPGCDMASDGLHRMDWAAATGSDHMWRGVCLCCGQMVLR